MNSLEQKNLASLHRNNLPSLFIQQTHDRAGSFTQLTNCLTLSPNCTSKEVAGNDHLYNNVTELGTIINGWLKNVHG